MHVWDEFDALDLKSFVHNNTCLDFSWKEILLPAR